MMQTLRNNTMPIFLITIFAFVVGFVFLEGQRVFGSGGGQDQNAIAVVNGTSIEWRAYSQQYAAAQAAVQGTVTPSIRNRLKRSSFEELVQLTLLQQAAASRGLATSPEEVLEVLRRNPPPDLVQSPMFQTNGTFDMSKYYQQLANPRFLEQMVGLYLQQLPIEKLNNLVASGAKTPIAEAMETADARAQRATISYIRVSPSLFGPDPASFSREEVEAYYRDRLSDYTPEQTATLTYAYLPRTPSPLDSLEVTEVLESIYLELEAGEAFDELLDIHSEAPRTMRGGALGRFIGDDAPAMTPELLSALDTLAVGAYTKPFNDAFGFHVVMLDSTRTDDEGGTSYRIKDLRMRVEISSTTERALEQAILGMYEDVRKRGGDIRAVTDTSKAVRVFTTRPIDLSGEPGFIDGNMPVFAEVVTFSREAEPGALGSILEGPGGYYIYHLDRRGPGDARELDEIETLVRADMVVERGAADAMRLAEEIARRAREGETLEAVAESDTLLRVETSRPFPRALGISGIGKVPEIIGAAFVMDVGEIAGPFEGDQGLLYVVRLDERTESVAAQADGTLSPEAAAAQLSEVQNMKRDLVLTSFLEHLRRDAKIRDLRPIKTGTL